MSTPLRPPIAPTIRDAETHFGPTMVAGMSERLSPGASHSWTTRAYGVRGGSPRVSAQTKRSRSVCSVQRRPPESRRSRIRFRDDRLQAVRPEGCESLLRGLQKPGGQSAAPPSRGDGETLDAASPAVPGGDDRPHQLPVRLGYEERTGIVLDEPLQALEVIGVAGLDLSVVHSRSTDGRSSERAVRMVASMTEG